MTKRLLQFLNGYHTPWLDPVMLILTETITWLPLYLFLLYLVIKEYKKESWMILLGIGLTILLADQITASIMKPYFARLRPSREPTLEGLVHLVQGYTGGQFGFASSHAANSFGRCNFFLPRFWKLKKVDRLAVSLGCISYLYANLSRCSLSGRHFGGRFSRNDLWMDRI